MKEIELLAKHNGRDAIFRKAKEECAELIVALSQFEEFGKADRYATIGDICEEIADVEIMCDQLKYILHGKNITEQHKAEKIERQLTRFGLDRKDTK